jgi:hypothetical protein
VCAHERKGERERESSPVNFSPKRVRNMVKLRGPGASDIIPSTTESLGSWPARETGGKGHRFRSGLGLRKWVQKEGGEERMDPALT